MVCVGAGYLYAKLLFGPAARFFVSNWLTGSLRNSSWVSTTLANLLDGVALVLAGVVSGSISAFLGSKLFQKELAARQRQWYLLVILGTLAGYLAMAVVSMSVYGQLLTAAAVDWLVAATALLGGGIAGIFQWLALRRAVRAVWLWIPIVAVSWMIVSLIFLSLVSFAAKLAPLD